MTWFLFAWLFACVAQAQSLLHDTGLAVASCTHAIDVTTQQSCAAQCERSCGLAPGSEASWSLVEAEAACLDALPHCVVPVGLHTSVAPQSVWRRTLHTDIWDYDRFSDRESNIHRGRWFASTRLKYHASQNVLSFGREWTQALASPERLAWAVLRVQGPALLGDDRACSYLEFVAPASDDRWTPLPLKGLNLGHSRDGAFAAHMGNRVSRVGPSGAPPVWMSPSIAALVQQWYLATETTPADMHLSVILHQDADFFKAPSPNWDSYEFSLELMTAFDWRGAANADCVGFASCGECVRELQCHWCDLTQVPAEAGAFWAAGRAAVSTRSGSRCGVSPVACHFLGGTSRSQQCPLEWNAAWEG
eukprot:Gregarina_sp_Pseudo_9__3680@NODE_382_length_2983_cov_18_573030_g361_i0_p2_GENE_NODE_382_length_2983_cov_18_573030_g361_i0NODE_382_length_2983_cov_18_573030_g361_i0_p2_ORF_typecomplete_len362_score122_08PriA_CRR/PF18319_1/1_3e03PriA_CRR/PF18319_1/81PriA_CRR/PF18319_1/0_41_NODE_382_length_2983_cov_18_573030_g361_i01891274